PVGGRHECVDESVTRQERAVPGTNRRCGRIRASWLSRRAYTSRARQEQAVEYCEGLNANVHLEAGFRTHSQRSAQSEPVSGLPLPTVVVVVGGCGTELTRSSVRPAARVQYQLRRGVETFAIRVEVE